MSCVALLLTYIEIPVAEKKLGKVTHVPLEDRLGQAGHDCTIEWMGLCGTPNCQSAHQVLDVQAHLQSWPAAAEICRGCAASSSPCPCTGEVVAPIELSGTSL